MASESASLDALIEEATVDADGESEQATAFLTALDARAVRVRPGKVDRG